MAEAHYFWLSCHSLIEQLAVLMDENAATTSAAGRRGVAARRDYLVGIALLILVVLLWTASNFLTNNILTSGWDKPFAVTYANTSSFSL